MQERKQAMLTMKKTLRVGNKVDTRTYICNMASYDKKTESLYLLLMEGELAAISLDAIYECKLKEAEYDIVASGRIEERYRCEIGNIIKMKIENGFYKNNIKSVDKR